MVLELIYYIIKVQSRFEHQFDFLRRCLYLRLCSLCSQVFNIFEKSSISNLAFLEGN